MAKNSGLIITKNTIASSIDQYTDVLFNRTRAVLVNSAASVMEKTADNSPVLTGRLQNSFKQGGKAKQAVPSTKITNTKDTKSKNSFPKFSKLKSTNRVIKNFTGEKDTFVELKYQPNREVSITFGTDVPYAKFPEFGTSRQKAQLYFTKGFNSKKNQIKKYIKDNLTV